MLKLVKYEFRKALGMFLALIGVTAALEVFFLVSLYREHEDGLIISMVLLMLCVYAVALFVFIRGVTSYSGELKNKSSYLVFMTPNSCRKIVGSKFVYTFVNGLLFVALFAVLAVMDIGLAMGKYYEYGTFWEGIKGMLSLYGVYVDQILYGGLFVVAYVFLSVLATVGVAYFAITVSHTLFRDKKWRWLPALVLFAALTWGINYVCGKFPSAMDQLVMVDMERFGMEREVTMQIAANTMRDIIVPSLLPLAGVSLATILASWLGCSALLEHKVSL